MASEAVLKELFEVAKTSPQFKGMSENDIWEACQAYTDRSDEDIRIAMGNMQKKDQKAVDKAGEQKRKIEENKEKMIALHEQEAIDHKKDEQSAEKVLEELFNS